MPTKNPWFCDKHGWTELKCECTQKKKEKPKAVKVEVSDNEKQIWDWYILGLKQKLPETAGRLKATNKRMDVITDALKKHGIGTVKIALRAFFRDEWIERWNHKSAWDIRYAIGSFPQKGDMVEQWAAKAENPKNVKSDEAEIPLISTMFNK